MFVISVLSWLWYFFACHCLFRRLVGIYHVILTLILWRWTLALYRLRHDQTLYQILATSNNSWLSYSDTKIENLRPSSTVGEFTIGGFQSLRCLRRPVTHPYVEFQQKQTICGRINQSISQSINLYRAIVQRRVLHCGYAESKRNVLRRILNVLTDGTVRQFSGREFQSLGAATEKRRAAVSTLCGGTDRSFCVDDRSKRDWLYGLINSAR